MKTRTFISFILFCFLLPAMASPDDKTVFNIRSFGAVGDGTNLDSPAIDRAILAAAEAGFLPEERRSALVVGLKKELKIG